ncbi:hypothetical protein [Enterococcus hirae]|uniref:hypothetical protein n=1 Tax=Enterococcus hirae TaxID=1354 RepID=UPI0006B1EE47|nr:hypothetical protein [Enterococcus hirae]EMF0430253.1 hypothetical protein [Enterococcus faecium]EMF0155433.1 hypothetical protein [Enterococcus hirae]EMF0272166.1 hypothetical protein [Enterococcus hirae]EMF0391880.1 hypothetical protein [Enterococcus hirae]EMF0594104.1 hypothetical protein [Enterococcus faecium]
MTEKEFEERFAKMLDLFDDMYDQEENYLRNVERVKEQMPNATEAEKMMFLQDSINRERTNNLVRVALKEFLLN